MLVSLNFSSKWWEIHKISCFFLKCCHLGLNSNDSSCSHEISISANWKNSLFLFRSNKLVMVAVTSLHDVTNPYIPSHMPCTHEEKNGGGLQCAMYLLFLLNGIVHFVCGKHGPVLQCSAFTFSM